MRADQSSPELRGEFVEKLRILFDILDTSGTGHVSYDVLCCRFREVPKPNLPPTFLNCVGKVTPASGYITFDRFLTAVKLSMRDAEINNNSPGTLYRVQSEGRLAQSAQKRSPPTMGVNGFDRRSAIYSSNPSISPPNYEAIPAYSQVVLRPKKATVRSQKEESRMRHPGPPSGQPQKVQVQARRPVSTNSYNSIASSGLENVVWRNSVMSSSNSDSTRRNTVCEEEAFPRIAKLSGLHLEEDELIRRGMDTASRLVEWYNERKDTIDKRQRLLDKGCVSLDTAVHEQRLNFLRAHVTELNRRMVALMETSEKGFPTHINLQKGNLPQPHDDQLVWLHRQNRQLNNELSEKSKQIEELKNEKEAFERRITNNNSVNHSRIQPLRPSAAVHRPSAFVRPAPHAIPQMKPVSASPVKVYDTLM